MKVCLAEHPSKDADNHPMELRDVRFTRGEPGNNLNGSYITMAYRCYNCGLIVKSITAGGISK